MMISLRLIINNKIIIMAYGTVSAMTFSDVTKQNGRASVWSSLNAILLGTCEKAKACEYRESETCN